MLETEDLKSTVKDAKKMKTVSCAGSPILFFMTFLSDAGGQLDLGINLEWP